MTTASLRDSRMSFRFQCVWLFAILLMGPAANAAKQEDSAELARRGAALSARGDYAGVAEAFLRGVSRAPGSADLWMNWADFGLERFRVLQLELRRTQSGMAVVLRLEAEGLPNGTKSREALLRRSATADPEQNGIWGELGVEQLRCGMREEAAAALKTAQDRQLKNSWTLQLEAMMAASRGDWKEAQAHLLELGSRSPAVLRSAMQSWPRELIPPKEVSGALWDCMRSGSTACFDKIDFPEGEVPSDEEQLFAEERWERLAAQPEPLLPAAWFRRGVALAQLNDCPRGIPALERGLEPGAEAAAYWLERCYASEAERAAAQLGALGRQAEAHRLRGDILVRVKEDAQAATAEYSKARQLEPRNPVLSERLAQAYMSLGELQPAKQAAREALALDPRRPVALRLLASIAMNERDYAGALEFLNKMLAMRPNDAWTRVQLGIAYAQTEQPQRALDYLQPVLAAGYPDERGALHATLAGVLRELGREQEAQTATAEANRLSDLFQQHAQKSGDDHQ
jgi:tetratricopeptide (TPR) repeat protein